MSEYFYFGDEMDNQGNICRSKLADCAFAKVRPGDILGVYFYHEDADGWRRDAGMLFVKAVSVKMPAAAGLFSGEKGGQVTVELPNGQRCELMEFHANYYGSKRAGANYLPTKTIGDYFNTHCYPATKWNYTQFVIPAGQEADLKDMMVKEKQRRAGRKQELEEIQRQRQAAQAARAREDAARRASVSRKELDDLFSKM